MLVAVATPLLVAGALFARCAYTDTLVRSTPAQRKVHRIVLPRDRVRVLFEAGAFPTANDAWYGLTLTDAQHDLTLKLRSADGSLLAHCDYPRDRHQYVAYTQTTYLACRVRQPQVVSLVAIASRSGYLRAVVAVVRVHGEIRAGYLLRPQRAVTHRSRAGAALDRLGVVRPAALGGIAFLAAVALSVAAAVAGVLVLRR